MEEMAGDTGVFSEGLFRSQLHKRQREERSTAREGLLEQQAKW